MIYLAIHISTLLVNINFQNFTITNKASLSVCILVSLSIYARVSLYSEIELLGITICAPSILKNIATSSVWICLLFPILINIVENFSFLTV